MCGSPAVPTMRQKVSARKFHIPVPVGTLSVLPNFALSLLASGFAWARAVFCCAVSFSTSASESPLALSLVPISSASFCQSARVSFSLASAVRRSL